MKLRRLLVAVLVLVLLSANLLTVLANLQTPVTNLSISDYTPPNATSYTVNLKWTRPPASNILEEPAALIGSGQSPTERAEGYEVYLRNATKSEQFTVPINDPGLLTDTREIINNQYTLNLENGSIYEFRVHPFHHHTIPNLSAPGTFRRHAPMDNRLVESRALYMTDIGISARGAGHSMTVTWDIPTIDGMEIFTSYRISHTVAGDSATQIPMRPFVEVNANSPDLIRTREGKMQFTFQDRNLQIGKRYAVKIEPLINGREARTMQTITIGGRQFDFAYRSMSTREYRTDGVFITPALFATAHGQDFVRIFWDSLKSSMDNIESIEIFSSRHEDMSEKNLIGILSGSSARGVNFWLTPWPDDVTYYQIVINYANQAGSVWSEIAWFDPTHHDFVPYKPNILSIRDNERKPLQMDIQWLAFIRPAYNHIERQNLDPVFNNRFIDRNLIYDIYVTDDIRNFDDPLFNDKIVVSLPASGLNLSPFGEGNNRVPSFTASVTEFYSKSETGQITRQLLQDNVVYYVRIVAVRDPGGQISRPSIASHYIRPVRDVHTAPLMITRPPLRIKVDELGIEEITNDSITIQWDTKFFEVYNIANRTWSTLVGVGDDGALRFGLETENISDRSKVIRLNDPEYLITGMDETALLNILRDKGAILGENATLPVRFIDLEGSQFEIHTAKFDHIQTFGGYEEYLTMLETSIDSDQLWTSITPEGEEPHPEYTITQQDAPTRGGLVENTAYVIYFRPYTIQDGEKSIAYFPSYIIATTLGELPPMEITPIVPVLEAVGQTDTTVTVRWRFSPELIYELQYSDMIGDFPNDGTIIPWDTDDVSIRRDGQLSTDENGNTYMTYTIPNLFPFTMQHIWIRSGAANGTEIVHSRWSNPVSIRTLDIIRPNPPHGLGPADPGHVDLFNRANNRELVPRGETYLILQWMRNQLDRSEIDNDGNASMPDFPAPTDITEFMFVPEAQDMFMAMFGELVPNRLHFIRAKTTLTVSRENNGPIISEYSYTIQLANNREFLDFREITGPILRDLSDYDEVRRAESEWSRIIHVPTMRCGSEYDGDVNPDMFPLPDRDYEIIYEDSTRTLTFRFRTNEIDQDGNHDNNVDQRFISRLIEKRTNVYNVDLTRYFYLPVKRRILELPYSIFTAFEERQIALRVTADNISVTFPPGHLPKDLDGFGVDSRILITLTEDDQETPALGHFDVYASRPHRLNMRVRSPIRETRIDLTALPIEIEMHLLHPIFRYPANVGAYIAHMDTIGWEQQEAKPNMSQDSLSFETYEPALFSAIAAGTPVAVQAEQSGVTQAILDAIQYVNSRVRITDVDILVPNSAVSAGMLNQLVFAIANNRIETELSSPLDLESRDDLIQAGLFTNLSPVSRQDAITVLVRLYELRMGRPVIVSKNIYQTPFVDIMQAAEEYREPLLKAAQLGMLSAANEWNRQRANDSPLFHAYRANPSGILTTGDLFKMLEILLRDSQGRGPEAP